MACWDLAGKALGEPVYNLLGGLFHDKLRAYTYRYGWKVGDPPEQAAEDILRYVERGFTAVKLDPVGGLEPHRLETLSYVEGVIRAMREAAGDCCDILIGTHGQLTTHAAIRLAKRLEPYEPLWMEEPVAPGNIDREILKDPIVWQDGYIIPPTAPGLGYELDEERIAPHLVAQA